MKSDCMKIKLYPNSIVFHAENDLEALALKHYECRAAIVCIETYAGKDHAISGGYISIQFKPLNDSKKEEK